MRDVSLRAACVVQIAEMAQVERGLLLHIMCSAHQDITCRPFLIWLGTL